MTKAIYATYLFVYYFSQQCCLGTGNNFYFHVITFADIINFLRKYNYFILAVPAFPICCIFFTITFNQDGEFFSQVSDITFMRKPVLHCNNFLQSSFFHLFINIIFITTLCKCTWTLTVKEHITEIIAAGLHDGKCVVVVRFFLGT